MDAKTLIEEICDHLAPRLDTYELAIYLYVLRHTRLQGLDDEVMGFKSARKRMAFGIGEKGKPMSEGTCYEKLETLKQKGCIEIRSGNRGSRVRAKFPSEITGVIPAVVVKPIMLVGFVTEAA